MTAMISSELRRTVRPQLSGSSKTSKRTATKSAAPVMQVRRMTVRATQQVAQLVDSAWDAMVVAVGKGKLLFRRRKDLRAGHCPLLRYENAGSYDARRVAV